MIKRYTRGVPRTYQGLLGALCLPATVVSLALIRHSNLRRSLRTSSYCKHVDGLTAPASNPSQGITTRKSTGWLISRECLRLPDPC